jgi:hypothetical protein
MNRPISERGESLPSHSGRLSGVERGMNVLALVKGSERYVFLYDDDSLRSLLQTLGRYAADPELSFTWYDAAILSQKVRRLRDERRQQHFSTERFPETT